MGKAIFAHRWFRKSVSGIVAMVFALTFHFPGVDSFAQNDQPPIAATEENPTFANLDPETITIPEHLGEIKYRSKGSSDKFIVHIQDAHCNVFAQERISDIINYLSTEYGMNMVNMEGGEGEYDLTVFTSIKGDEIRREVAQYFMKKGDINGAEFYAISNPGNVFLWGVEDRDLYIRNLKVYRESLAYKKEADEYLKFLSRALNELKQRIYPRDLLKIDMKYSAYKAGNIEFREYLEFLIGYAEKEHIDIKTFRNLYHLSTAMGREGDVDFRKANNERDGLVKEINGRLSQNEARELVSRTIDFKTNVISRKVFYGYLLGKARDLGLDTGRFPALAAYVDYVTLYEEVNRSEVMEELNALEKAVKEPFFRNDTERELDVLSKDLAIMKNMFSVTLTKTDYKYYIANKGSFGMARFLDFIRKEASKLRIQLRPDEGITRLDGYREELSKFYDYSFERDKEFIRNMRYGAGAGETKAAMLMTGGFHTENLLDLFEKEEISYISVLPKFTSPKDYQNPYFELLAGQTTDLQGMLKSVIARASMIQVASKLTELGRDVWGEQEINAYKMAVQFIAKLREDHKDALTNIDGVSEAKEETSEGKSVITVIFDMKQGETIPISLAKDYLLGLGGEKARGVAMEEDSLTGNIAGEELRYDRKELSKVMNEIEKQFADQKTIKQDNKDLIEAVQERASGLLDEKEKIREILRKYYVSEARIDLALGALENVGDSFKWFNAVVEGPEKYLLGQESALALNVVEFLRDKGDRLLDEYLLHEALERTPLTHLEIILVTSEVFGRGDENFISKLEKGDTKPGQTPLGKALRYFINTQESVRKGIDRQLFAKKKELDVKKAPKRGPPKTTQRKAQKQAIVHIPTRMAMPIQKPGEIDVKIIPDKRQTIKSLLNQVDAFLQTFSKQDILNLANKINAGEPFKMDDISSEVNVGYFAEGASKHVFKIEIKTKDGKKIKAILALKKSKTKDSVSDQELADLITLNGQGVPRFCGSYETGDGSIWFFEEFIDGKTAAALGISGGLTAEMRKNVVKTLLTISNNLEGQIPQDCHSENFIIREGTNEAIMVDIGATRISIEKDGSEDNAKVLFAILEQYGWENRFFPQAGNYFPEILEIFREILGPKQAFEYFEGIYNRYGDEKNVKDRHDLVEDKYLGRMMEIRLSDDKVSYRTPAINEFATDEFVKAVSSYLAENQMDTGPPDITGNIARGMSPKDISVIGAESMKVIGENGKTIDSVKARGEALSGNGERMGKLEEILKNIGKTEEDIEIVKNALRDPEHNFKWFNAEVKGQEEYILGYNGALAVNVVKYLIAQENRKDVKEKDLLDEYLLHEALEKIDLGHNDIIEITSDVFNREKGVSRGETPLGNALRGFINAYAQVEAAKTAIGDFRKKVSDWIIIPYGEELESSRAAVDTAVARKFRQDYDTGTMVRGYLCSKGGKIVTGEDLIRNMRETFEKVLGEMMNEKYANEYPRAIAVVGPDMYKYALEAIRQIKEEPPVDDILKMFYDPQRAEAYKERISSVFDRLQIIQETVPTSGVIDETMHVVSGKAFNNVLRFRKGDFPPTSENKALQDIAEKNLIDLLKTLVENPEAIDKKMIEDILNGLAILKIRPINFEGIREWKQSQDALLRSL